MKKTFGFAVLGTVMALASANFANADIVTVNAIGSPVAVAGGSQWTYQATLTADQELATTGTQFFTVYGFDFGSATPTITASTGVLATDFTPTLTLAGSGALTEAENQDFPQSYCGANCYDIRFTYDDSALMVGGPTVLGTFTVDTSDSIVSTAESFYDGQATGLDSNGKVLGMDGNNGHVLVASAAPEPMTMALLGSGLGLLGLARLRRSAKKN